MGKIKNAVVSVYVFFRPGKPVSRKVVAAGLTSLFVYMISIIAVKRFGHLDETQTDMISVAASQVAGFCAGWLRKEFPEVVSDGQDVPQSSLAAPALLPDGGSAATTVTSAVSAANAAEPVAGSPAPADPGPPPRRR